MYAASYEIKIICSFPLYNAAILSEPTCMQAGEKVCATSVKINDAGKSFVAILNFLSRGNRFFFCAKAHASRYLQYEYWNYLDSFNLVKFKIIYEEINRISIIRNKIT